MTWLSLLILFFVWLCGIISCGALLYAVIVYRAWRATRLATFERGRE